jgi:putative FmdB family regulatory protein
MPVYIYEHIDECGDCPKEFEHYEKITSKGIKVCPICGNPVRRIIKDVNFTIDHLAPSRLNELGFKKLVRKDKGVYEAENKQPGEKKRKLLIDKSLEE